MGDIRIIGGRFRGSKIPVPELPDLRPTPNRIRETLFNWLAPIIHGATCLDLFAGAGGLGLEALSRGAKKVVFIDNNPIATQHIQAQINRLAVDNATVHQYDAIKGLEKLNEKFDVIFLDPPFQSILLKTCCQALIHSNLLNQPSWVYVETSKQTHEELFPETWVMHRQKHAGNVAYQLLKID